MASARARTARPNRPGQVGREQPAEVLVGEQPAIPFGADQLDGVGHVYPLSETAVNATPLIFAGLSVAIAFRAGPFNIGATGQFIGGAWSPPGLGLIAGSLAGGLRLTGYLYDRVIVPRQNTLSSGVTFSSVKIPLLGDIPLLGPVFFDSTVFLYITYFMIIFVQVGLFSTRWGLRVRAVGEHPTAADAVGIRVLGTRYRNVILGGLLAGIGGAWLTIGSTGTFGKDMSSGLGYIALAALIFGRWTPLDAVTAALLFFSFTGTLQSVLSTLNVPIPSDILLMAPYVATIVAVAGLVGRGRPPRADGRPYIT